jgi:hypothetical protein
VSEPTASDVVEAFCDALALAVRYATRAQRMHLRINGKLVEVGNMVDIPDDRPFGLLVDFEDKFGNEAREPGPVSFTTDQTDLVTITPNTMLDGSGAVVPATDDMHATAQVNAGSGTFNIMAESGALSLETPEPCNIVAGSAVSGHVNVELTQVTQTSRHRAKNK